MSPSDAQSAVKVGFKTSEDGAVCKYPLELNADGKSLSAAQKAEHSPRAHGIM